MEQSNVFAKETLEDKAKQEWATKMRLKFTPSEMLLPDGSLNKEYFKVTVKYVTKENQRKWGEKEKKLLTEGIEKHGVGNWGAIQKEFLPKWRPDELRVKGQHLMGRQSLALYKGWKGDAAAIEKEFRRNYQIGIETGFWKGQYLVADDAGVVAERIQATESTNTRIIEAEQDNVEEGEYNVKKMNEPKKQKIKE